jgi:predicted nucleic acid-binding protein
MNDKQIFVDTNILVYAHDREAGRKHHLAKEHLKELWLRELPPAISVQVLQEFYVTLIRKGVVPKIARETVSDYLKWEVVDNDQSLFVESIELEQRWKLSFWDASVLAAARRAKAKILWTEDFAVGQDYGGISVVNPLREP